jgi:hypothetical protein
MLRVSSRDSGNTVRDTNFRVSRNIVQDGVLTIGHCCWREGEHRVRPYKTSVYLEHEFEDVGRSSLFARTNFKFVSSWVTVPLIENLWLERTI